MNNLKPIMKQTTLGDSAPNPSSFGKGLLKKKPFGKPVGSGAGAASPSSLMQRLTGKC